MVKKLFDWVYTSFFKEKMGTITHVITNEPLVALTFDDGPDIETTLSILELLGKNNSRGTFFVTGENAERHPGIVRRMAAGGHAFGNHSWDHPSFPLISGKERRRQMRACEKIISGYTNKLFRPPYGDQSHASRFDALLMGYKVITWNLLAQDWLNIEPAGIAERLLGEMRPGSIILFHDTLYTVSDEGPRNGNLTFQVLEILFHNIGNKFQFVTIPELLKRGIPFYEKWYQQPNIDYLNKLRSTKGRKNRRYDKSKKSNWNWEQW